MNLIQCRKTVLVKPKHEKDRSVCEVFGNPARGGYYSIPADRLSQIVSAFAKKGGDTSAKGKVEVKKGGKVKVRKGKAETDKRKKSLGRSDGKKSSRPVPNKKTGKASSDSRRKART